MGSRFLGRSFVTYQVYHLCARLSPALLSASLRAQHDPAKLGISTVEIIRPHATRIGLTQRDVSSFTTPGGAPTSLETLRTEIRDVLSEVRRVEAKFDAPLGLGMVNEQRARFSAMEKKLGTLEEWIKR